MMQNYVIDSSGKKRAALLVECLHCGKKFLKDKRQVISRPNHYCGQECFKAHRSADITVEIRCANCGKDFVKRKSKMHTSKSGLYFCCRSCKDAAQRIGGIEAIQPPHYGNGEGIHDYREKALKHYGCKCEVCGYDEYVEALQVHHIDGNRRNNDIDNLVVLCANHHALLTVKVAVFEDRVLKMGL
jgi:hypothetical protein